MMYHNNNRRFKYNNNQYKNIIINSNGVVFCSQIEDPKLICLKIFVRN